MKRAALGLALALPGLFLLRRETPRWTAGGSRPVTVAPLPAESVPVLAPGGLLLCQGDSNLRGKPAVAQPFCVIAASALGARAELRGAGGDTAGQGATRWANAPPVQADLVVLLYGSNDAAPRAWLGRRRPVPPASYRASLAALVRDHRGRGAQVLVLAPPPAGSRAMAGRLAPYRAAAREAAAAAGAAFLDPAEAFAEATDPVLTWDGLHLNARGHLRLGKWLASRLKAPRAPAK